MATATPPQRVSPVIPTAAETAQHPAFPTAIWNLEADRKGVVPVAEGRGGPLKISWEIHGDGPVKVIFIMGLGGLKTTWQRQTLHFGHERREHYSVLVMDNRGMGDSDKPLMRYSTSEMARDVAEVLAHVGWLPSYPPTSTPPPARNLHIVGISLGGMIAQELACLVAEHVSSLSMCCTAAAIENTTTFAENMANRAQLLVPKSLDRSIADGARNMFGDAWLAEPDNAHVPDPATTPKVLPPTTIITAAAETAASAPGPPAKYLKFDSNAERFVAQELTKRQDRARFGRKGFLLQLIAAGWHHKSADQLREIGDRVGRERILVMHGTEDRMITVPHGRKLIAQLEPGTALLVEGMGHAPIVERWEWYNGLLEDHFAVGEKLDGRA
ncbi:Alpha/Beta hydrolase protein [Lasiosphaeria miniovina]|uniref:Alpha/Beta hydrolase protein n=1 Tax=Lasiosphaeria miniovina TaxID=1954250 RepID=A0AA40ADQ9_9PEZI|nr:Alpha/Beta hydrolase protein [Lasiosphaeria miniovina]KAK0713980.1 Alpha/Beta hydrolase protein [Lasiosphaeria miniovina]